jgi:hypothetical protein
VLVVLLPPSPLLLLLQQQQDLDKAKLWQKQAAGKQDFAALPIQLDRSMNDSAFGLTCHRFTSTRCNASSILT